jgi:Holliday junction resolvasome RuvABC endonuclease subunit
VLGISLSTDDVKKVDWILKIRPLSELESFQIELKQNEQSSPPSSTTSPQDHQQPLSPVEIRIRRLMTITELLYSIVLQEHHSHIYNQQHQSQAQHGWVGIEGYSFQSKGSSSVSILCELGGMLRSKFQQNHWRMAEIPPTVVKKEFTGNGLATKQEMFITFQTMWSNKCNLNIQQWFPTKVTDKSIPHPLEDCIDSFALMRCMSTFQHNMK